VILFASVGLLFFIRALARSRAGKARVPMVGIRNGKPSGSRVAWLMLGFVVLMAAIGYLSNHFQQRSIELLEWENSLLQRRIRQGEGSIERRLRSLCLDWDSYSIELTPDSSRSIWHFVGLRELRSVSGTSVWTRIDGNLHVEVLEDGDWQGRGDGQLGHVQFTVATSGKSDGTLPAPSPEPPRLPATKSPAAELKASRGP